MTRDVLALRATTLLVFVSRTAWTGIVSSDLGRAAYHLLHLLEIARTGHTRLFQLSPFLALKGFFDFVDRCRDLPGLAAVAIPTHSRNRHARLWTCARTAIDRSRRPAFGRPLQNLHQVEIADR